MPNCIHFDEVDEEKYRDYDVCIDCILNEDTWVNLRTCQNCGGTRCCDSSPNTHATKHSKKLNHPVIKMLENQYLWCYEHEEIND